MKKASLRVQTFRGEIEHYRISVKKIIKRLIDLRCYGQFIPKGEVLNK